METAFTWGVLIGIFYVPLRDRNELLDAYERIHGIIFKDWRKEFIDPFLVS